jgi:hypothetical protein
MYLQSIKTTFPKLSPNLPLGVENDSTTVKVCFTDAYKLSLSEFLVKANFKTSSRGIEILEFVEF